MKNTRLGDLKSKVSIFAGILAAIGCASYAFAAYCELKNLSIFKMIVELLFVVAALLLAVSLCLFPRQKSVALVNGMLFLVLGEILSLRDIIIKFDLLILLFTLLKIAVYTIAGLTILGKIRTKVASFILFSISIYYEVNGLTALFSYLHNLKKVLPTYNPYHINSSIATLLATILVAISLLIFIAVIQKEEKHTPILDTVRQSSIVLNILLSFVTCGIYSIFWVYSIIGEIKWLNGDDTKSIKEILCYSLVPYYIYYWIFTRSRKIVKAAAEKGIKIKDHSTRNLLLAIFYMSPISIGMIQNSLNAVAKELVGEDM